MRSSFCKDFKVSPMRSMDSTLFLAASISRTPAAVSSSVLFPYSAMRFS